MAADPIEYSARWPVRHYELDRNGHVNNAVYLNYAEHLTIEHAERAGYGAQWTAAQGGGWLVHRNAVRYHRAAVYGDVLDLTVRVLLVRGTRGVRRTTILRECDGELLAEVLTEWVWVRLSDGRPARVPQELVDVVRGATAATLREHPSFLQDLRRLL
ncbi:MAG TPA: acyl-CoA thioesterase [Candidatus Binatia bacterium]|nr:acyl-CoA thioesterase [Candidatus Binatia bacterium]